MYSHLRNDFILSLTKNFNTSEITMILASLDACIENIECIQKLLGHSNISTTQIYAEISDTEVRNAHKKYIV